jgi:hypothetical protein
MAQVTLKLRQYIEDHDLNARQVEREAGIGENTIYRVMRATNLNRDSLAGIIMALRKLTGKPVEIADVLEYSDHPELDQAEQVEHTTNNSRIRQAGTPTDTAPVIRAARGKFNPARPTIQPQLGKLVSTAIREDRDAREPGPQGAGVGSRRENAL